MKSILQKIKLQTALLILPILFTFSFFTFTFVALSTLDEVRIHGPSYGPIEASNDLIADSAPPSVFVLEAYSHLMQAVDANDPARRVGFIADFREHESAYVSRIDLPPISITHPS